MTPPPRHDRFQLFADSVKEYAFIQIDTSNRVTDWNRGAERLLGYTEAEIVGQPAAVFFTPEDRARNEPEHEIRTATETGTAEDERWHMRKDGSRFRASGVLTAQRSESGELLGFAKVMRDVTEREKTRERLQQSLNEKDALLREIHHRVKNNLQVVISLLSLQARYVQDSRALGSFEETQNRVRAIARIHEALYGTNNLASISFGPYLRQLVSDMASFYDVGQKIRTEVEAADMTFEIERAVPLALITNELVCNAMKHAFPGRERGSLSVKLRAFGSRAQLEVADTGVGIPLGVDPALAESMGFNLVRILVEQLEGELQVKRSGGTCLVVLFPIQPEQS